MSIFQLLRRSLDEFSRDGEGKGEGGRRGRRMEVRKREGIESSLFHTVPSTRIEWEQTREERGYWGILCTSSQNTKKRWQWDVNQWRFHIPSARTLRTCHVENDGGYKIQNDNYNYLYLVDQARFGWEEDNPSLHRWNEWTNRSIRGE